jgi:hypothetical protein
MQPSAMRFVCMLFGRNGLLFVAKYCKCIVDLLAVIISIVMRAGERYADTFR